MQKDYKDVFQCLDWDKKMVLKPNYASSLVVRLLPCDKVKSYGYEIGDECIADEVKQKAYLDPN